MIQELCDIRIPPGKQAEFDEAIQRGIDQTISKAKGFRGYEVNKGIDTLERYVLTIFWDTVEDHTIGFRQSTLFQEWRAIVGPYFAVPPVVEHFTLLCKSN